MPRTHVIRDIPGIRVIKGSAMVFAPMATVDTASALVSGIDDGMHMWFYDEGYESPSDPGAFVKLFHTQGKLLAKWLNHGWSSDWVSISRQDAVAYLWSCRNENMSGKSNAIGYVGMRLEEPCEARGKMADMYEARRLSSYLRSRIQSSAQTGTSN